MYKYTKISVFNIANTLLDDENQSKIYVLTWIKT